MSTIAEQPPIGAEVEFLTPELRQELLTRWRDPRRRHHDEARLASVLRALDVLEAQGEAFDPTAVRLAAWFHGAEFDPTGSEGAENSACLAERLLDPAAPVGEVARLVRMTAGHHVEPGDLDAAAFSDAHLAVLGSGEEAYDAYVASVRDEYAHVADGAFARGRAVALENLLTRDAIFHTTTARDLWERRARANVNRELGLLRAG